MVPTVDEFQQAVTHAVQCIMAVFKTLPLWSITIATNSARESATVPGTAKERLAGELVLQDSTGFTGFTGFTARSETGFNGVTM